MENIEKFVDEINSHLEQEIRKLLLNHTILIAKHEKNITSTKRIITSKHHEIYLDELDLLLHKYYLNIARKLANKIYMGKKVRIIPKGGTKID
ncbi:MAG: hypothetical protein SFT68_05120 [Rickettsiaceae bacterium]|nr:hypothetical protein [Rickettsiaceae bacterium]